MYGTFIRQVRVSRGLTQVELALIVGIEQPNLSAYENNRQMPSADVLNRILVGCGYLLEATAGTRRIVCPLPRATWPADEQFPVRQRVPTASDRPLSVEPHHDDELSALKLEQVLALADSLRWSKAES
jgi:transcriptional regulator with XRE-family HTH domain